MDIEALSALLTAIRSREPERRIILFGSAAFLVSFASALPAELDFDPTLDADLRPRAQVALGNALVPEAVLRPSSRDAIPVSGQGVRPPLLRGGFAVSLSSQAYLLASRRCATNAEKKRLRKKVGEMNDFDRDNVIVALADAQKEADAFIAKVHRDEAAWIRAGVDVNAKFAEKYLRPEM